MESGDAGSQQIKGSRNASNGIVSFGRAIQRHDHVVQTIDDLVCMALNEEAGAQESGSNIPSPQEPAETEQVGMHERFAAGKHHPFDAQPGYIFGMPLQL